MISDKDVEAVLRKYLHAEKRVTGVGRDSQEHFAVIGIEEAAKRVAALSLHQCVDARKHHDHLMVIHDHLRSGAFGQREVWEQWLRDAASALIAEKDEAKS